MKRFARIFAAALLAAIALGVLLVALFPRETLKTRIGEQIAAWTGRDVSLRGEPEIDVFPGLTVTLRDVQVGGPPGMGDAEIISMDRLIGRIRVLPLIIGRVEIASFTMVRPLVRLVRDDQGARNWAFQSGAAALQLAFAGDVPLGDFLLEDGTLVYENRGTGTSERLDSVNLTVDWSSVRQPLAVAGSGIWRGEQVAFSAGAEAPFQFLNGAATPLEIHLDAAPLAMAFSGEASDLATPQLAGALTMSTPSLRGFAAWLGGPAGPGSTLGPASLAGAATFRDNVLSVEDAQLVLDGNSAAGALKVTAAARPAIVGTLAFPSLDLTPYFAGLAPAFAAGGDWRSVEIQTSWFSDLEADIRLSAGSVRAGALSFGDTAASVSLRDARLEIGLARAAFIGGSLTGDLAIAEASGANAATVEAQLRATGFDLAEAAQPVGLPQRFSGIASLMVDATGQGETLGALAGNLTGIARLGLENGSFPLFGIAEIAAGGGGGADPQGMEVAAATPVERLAASFALSGGIANLEMASIAALSFTADAKGQIGLLDGSLALDGTVRPAAASPNAAPALPFTIEGTLARPLARPLATLAN